MAKSSKDDRRARLEQVRREAARAERRRTSMVVGACVLVAVIIVAATGYALWNKHQEDARIAAAELADLGAVSQTAGCDPVETKSASGSAEHLDQGTAIDYPDAPPAFGSHWPVAADFATKFYTADDRPPVEQLVHNLEHGYTILWYDQSVADDATALAQIEDIAAKFEGSKDLSAKFIAAPWTSDDGDAFPEGKHVVLTHWSASGPDAAANQGQGDWQYCEAPSGEVLSQFMKTYPYSDALEPNAI